MTAPIDRLENVRAQIADIERQMEAWHAARVDFGPSLAWQLLSACKSLLGPTLVQVRREARAEALREVAEVFDRMGDPGEGDWLRALADKEATR